MVKIDLYTKAMLTIIAAALVGLVAQNYISEAWAATSVYVTNADEIGMAVYTWAD